MCIYMYMYIIMCMCVQEEEGRVEQARQLEEWKQQEQLKMEVGVATISPAQCV